MKYLLHIDTSTDTGTIAISGDGVLLASASSTESRNHAAAINNMIAEVCSGAGITLTDLAAVDVCAGPGSYTGLRIGMATAKGLCYALDKPLMAANRLELLAYSAHLRHGKEYSHYLSLLLARDKEYFIGIYNNAMKCMLQPVHVMEEQLENLINKGESTYIATNAPQNVITDLKINPFFADANIITDLKSWVRQSFEKYICNRFVNLHEIEPFYLKQVYTHK